ncbi:hypothetical protein KM043_009162 [Ampulex compressa]|nr:hypothetical protein KM043_009162 [Ampulex compressa]
MVIGAKNYSVQSRDFGKVAKSSIEEEGGAVLEENYSVLSNNPAARIVYSSQEKFWKSESNRFDDIRLLGPHMDRKLPPPGFEGLDKNNPG